MITITTNKALNIFLISILLLAIAAPNIHCNRQKTFHAKRQKEKVFISLTKVMLNCGSKAFGDGLVVFHVNIKNDAWQKIYFVASDSIGNSNKGFYLVSRLFKNRALKLQASDTYQSVKVESKGETSCSLFVSDIAIANELSLPFSKGADGVANFFHSGYYNVVYMDNTKAPDTETELVQKPNPKVVVSCFDKGPY